MDQPKQRQTTNVIPEVRAAVEPTIDKIGPWQERVAFIATAAGRPHTAEERLHFIAETGAIRRAVAAEAAAVGKRIAGLTERAAAQSRVVDAARALDRLEANLDDISDVLAG